MRKNSGNDAGAIFDEEFNKKMRVANFLVKNLERRRDIDIAKNYLTRVGNIKSSNLEVKKNRNAFLSYLIRVLGDAVLPGCSDDRSDTVCDPDNSLKVLHDMDNLSETSEETLYEEPPVKKIIKFKSEWSKDHRTYVAVKPLPGRGALVFMAVSKRPGLDNWDLPPPLRSSMKQK
ncbi:uncharacterized protein [Fopius arisanus]|uniref:DUF4485 domain-containing protein n=1 Tax=Fopius arisanus TaxID=64838 RepID=A0A9R1U611_9HYME|nr:PREDICTED: uncharacterized protein LOC105270811 [Fopius arisanus]